MRTMPPLSFEELHGAAPCRDQVGTSQESSENQMGVQPPTQSDEPIQRLLLALTDEEKSSGALRSVLGIKYLPKNKVTKLFGDHPHLWHSCDSVICDLLMLFSSRFYHECANVRMPRILIGYFLATPKHRPNFRDNYLHPALDAELIEMTIPEKPSSSKQKYRLTAKGEDFLAREGQEDME